MRVAPLLLLAACAKDPVPRAALRVERPLMGTVFRVMLQAEDTEVARCAIEGCFSAFARVDATMSEWKPGSPLSELTRRAGTDALVVPDELFELLVTARRVAEESDGAFDPTWAALWGLWRFDGAGVVPSEAELAARLEKVGWRDLELDPARTSARLRRPGMALGLGGIAKGYALGLCAELLRGRGYSDYVLYAGGQVYAAGRNGGAPWRAGIQDPRGREGDAFATIAVEDASLSTSGDYEHFFVRDGVRYHHILDLKTGAPARGVRSATVLAVDPTLADAYSTAAFVLGPERALALARARGFELLIVDDAGALYMSEGMRARLGVVHAPR